MTTLLDLSVMFAPMPVGVPLAQKASSNGTQVHTSFGVFIGSASVRVPVVALAVVVAVDVPVGVVLMPPPSPPFAPPPAPPEPTSLASAPPHAASIEGARATRESK